MDQEILKQIATQSLWAALFVGLGVRNLRQMDRLQEQNEKLVLQLLQLSQSSIDTNRATVDMMGKMGIVLDRVTARLEK